MRITNKIILIILRKFERIATPVPGQKNNSSEDFRYCSLIEKNLGIFFIIGARSGRVTNEAI